MTAGTRWLPRKPWLVRDGGELLTAVGAHWTSATATSRLRATTGLSSYRWSSV